MKFTIFVFTFLIFSINAQKKEDLFYEVTIQSGMGIYGITSVKFQFEGLLLRTYLKDETNFPIKKINYVSIDSLNSVKILDFFEFINKKNLLNLDLEYSRDENLPIYAKIRILNLVNGESVEYYYNKYIPKLDELIVLLNDLIPEQYRQYYQVQRIQQCKKSHR